MAGRLPSRPPQDAAVHERVELVFRIHPPHWTPGQLAVIISTRAHQPSLAWETALSSISQQSPIKTRALRETTWMTVDLQCSSLADMSCARP